MMFCLAITIPDGHIYLRWLDQGELLSRLGLPVGRLENFQFLSARQLQCDSLSWYQRSIDKSSAVHFIRGHCTIKIGDIVTFAYVNRKIKQSMISQSICICIYIVLISRIRLIRLVKIGRKFHVKLIVQAESHLNGDKKFQAADSRLQG